MLRVEVRKGGPQSDRSLFFLFHPEFVVVIYRMFGLIQATLLLPEVGPPFFF